MCIDYCTICVLSLGYQYLLLLLSDFLSGVVLSIVLSAFGSKTTACLIHRLWNHAHTTHMYVYMHM